MLILNGATGREKARIDWPSREGFEDYNRYSRNQLGIAYLDGKTPCLLVQRGTYSLIKLHAYEFHDGKLRELWHWRSTDETPEAGAPAHYHQLSHQRAGNEQADAAGNQRQLGQPADTSTDGATDGAVSEYVFQHFVVAG